MMNGSGLEEGNERGRAQGEDDEEKCMHTYVSRHINV